MSDILSRFKFVSDVSAFQEANAITVRIPKGVSTEAELFSIFDRELSLPDYFGENWNALDECLCDLGWIGSPEKVVIVHQDLPLQPNPEDLKIYLELLSDCIEWWEKREKPQFVVVFPLAEFEHINKVAHGAV
jgi:RNAse (barnase) inhibitor barstar